MTPAEALVLLALLAVVFGLLAWWLRSQERKHGRHDVNDDNDMGHW